jgi:hypothetical protein
MQLTTEQITQFSDILEEFGKTLDITKDQHEQALKSYEFVATHLAAENSPLHKYNPDIIPQGSFMLGTMVKPLQKDELDVDLVCRLEGKNPDWTQKDLKMVVGDRLKDHGTIKNLLETPDGRRCWTLQYADSAKFHMDILPAIVSTNYKIILEKAFSARQMENPDSLAIRITDKKMDSYDSSSHPEEWLKSNPFGYGIWFEQQATVGFTKAVMMRASVQPLPKFHEKKLPLQRVVQILKRHRDMMFNGDEDKPISISITTLAARAYRKETDILEALVNIIAQMPNEIEEKYSSEHAKTIKWIANPVNDEENFADKWVETPRKQENFYKWMAKVREDVQAALSITDKGLPSVVESFRNSFGEKDFNDAFNNYGVNQRLLRESGKMKMAATTGTVGLMGRTTIAQHQNFGSDE